MTSYLVGTGVTMRAADYRNESGVLVNPENVVLTYRRPSGVETVVPMGALGNPTVGTWFLKVVADEPGEWSYTFVATNPTVVGTGSFTVDPVATTPGRMQPIAGPCSAWVNETELIDGWTPPATASDAALVEACASASDVLFERSGRQFPGICSDRTRPLGSNGGLPIALPFGGNVIEVGWDGEGTFESPLLASHHQHYRDPEDAFELPLGGYPILSVQEVRVDGVVLDPSKWVVMDWSRLRRTDGVPWPCCNFILGDVARVEVDFTFGAAPPASGALAAKMLARELVKGSVGGSCALDARVEQLTREGVSITIPGLAATLRDGKTGIPAVDLFLWSHNPNGLQRRGRIIDPARLVSTRRRTFP